MSRVTGSLMSFRQSMRLDPGILTGSSSGAAALVDDFETDFWLPYTDFLLGDKASAGYSSTYVRSGTRSYHVDVSGYSILDFGSAYGYAVYATRGAAVTELRVSLLYDHLQDASVSSWDAYASGVALDLLDKDYRSLDRVRYITSFQASRKLSLCGPTKALSNGPGSRWRSTIPGRTISRSKSACPIDPDLPPSCCGIPASTRAGPRSSSPRAEPPSEGPSTSAAKLGSPIRSSTST